ncbi:MAG: hypothetical protein ACOC44_03900 [Promethearchaeia archaeon]
MDKSLIRVGSNALQRYESRENYSKHIKKSTSKKLDISEKLINKEKIVKAKEESDRKIQLDDPNLSKSSIERVLKKGNIFSKNFRNLKERRKTRSQGPSSFIL